MKNFKPIRLQLLMAVISIFSASPKSIDAQELLTPTSLAEFKVNVGDFEDYYIQSMVVVDDSTLAVLVKNYDTKVAHAVNISIWMGDDGLYKFDVHSSYKLTPGLNSHILKSNSVAVVLKVDDGYVAITDYEGQTIGQKPFYDVLKLDYFNIDGEFLSSHQIQYGRPDKSGQKSITSSIDAIKSDGSGGILIYGDDKNEKVKGDVNLLIYHLRSRGRLHWKKTIDYKISLNPEDNNSDITCIQAADCIATDKGIMLNGRVCHGDRYATNAFLLTMSWSGGVVNYEEFSSNTIPLSNDIGLYKVHPDEYIFSSNNYSYKQDSWNAMCFEVSFDSGLGKHLNFEGNPVSDVYQKQGSRYVLISKTRQANQFFSMIGSDFSTTWTDPERYHIRVGSLQNFRKGHMCMANSRRIVVFDVDYFASTKAKVEAALLEWQTKGKYEKLADFEKRTGGDSKKHLEDSLINDHLSFTFEELYEPLVRKRFEIVFYDTESEVFKMKHPFFGVVYFQVPIDVAQNFENALTYGKVSFTDLVPCYIGNKPSISSMNISYRKDGTQIKIKYSAAAPVIFEGEAVKPNGEIRSLIDVYKQTLDN